MAPAIVFAHANGFPAGVYRQVFDVWRAAGLEVHAVAKFGHDPRFPVTSNWPHLRSQLLECIARQAAGPVWLVGHSMGGYLALLAASRKPASVLGVVLLDSPIVAGWKARAVQLGKLTGLGERFSPAHVSKRRRQHWPSRAAARAHFAAKPAFAAWAPGVLDDYLDCGLEASAGGQRLAFDREVETAIYRGLPHHLMRLLRAHPLQCPVAFIGGTQSLEIRRAGLEATRRIVGSRLAMVEGGHLFPMEHPQQTARAVLQAIGDMQPARRPVRGRAERTPSL
jgi:pimeloyl-ACP methyl ester carboxylesterase